MFALQRLRNDLECAVFVFEQENRSYFARSISDRGDAYFEDFARHHRTLLADQQSGIGAFYVAVDDSGVVTGRFNLYDIQSRSANVGYRVAERLSGRGVATLGLRELCRIAREELGLQTLAATVSDDNIASRRVLVKSGFTPIGQADVGGRRGSAFELDLAGSDV